jgi:hypothetical protein
MTPARRWEFFVVLDCADRPDDPCRTFLPRESLLGDVVGQEYQPKGEWPATFLCIRHGRASVRLAADVRWGVEAQDPRLPIPPLWRIECVCGHENCGREHVIYVYKQSDWGSISRGILLWNPEIPCGSHKLVWREDVMRGEEISHDPGVERVPESPRGNP